MMNSIFVIHFTLCASRQMPKLFCNSRIFVTKLYQNHLAAYSMTNKQFYNMGSTLTILRLRCLARP